MTREPVRACLHYALDGAVADQVAQHSAAGLRGRRRHPHGVQLRRPEPDGQRELRHPGPGPAQQSPRAFDRDAHRRLAFGQAGRRHPAHLDLERRLGHRIAAKRPRAGRTVAPLFEQHGLPALDQLDPNRTETAAAGFRHGRHDGPGANPGQVGPDRDDGFRSDPNPEHGAGGDQGRNENRPHRRPGRPASSARFQANGFPSRERQDPPSVSRPGATRPSCRPDPRSSRS